MKIRLKFVSLDHIVLGLLDDGLVPAILFANADCCCNSRRSPLGCSPVKSKAFLNNVVHGSASFFEGTLVVRSVRKDNINVVKLQTLEGVLKAFDDMLARHHLVVKAVWRALIDLG